MTIDTNDFRERAKRGDISIAEAVSLCDEIDRLRKRIAFDECNAIRDAAAARRCADEIRPASTPQGKTVDVRVAVAVSSNSEWNAAGWYDGKHDVVVETAMDSAHFPATIFWLTATLPVPAEVEVVAKVEGEE